MTNNDELALKSEERIKAIANGAQMLMGESRQLAAAALYWKEQTRIATDAFQQSGIMQVKAEDKIEVLLAERDADKKLIADSVVLFDTLRQRIAELETVSTAAEKLVRCKGRYHSEQNYRALAALLGVTTPDLPPLETEARTVSVKLPDPFTKSMYGTALYEHDDIVKMLTAAGIKLEVGE